eukprot:86413-Rhodomonas_salina.5
MLRSVLLLAVVGTASAFAPSALPQLKLRGVTQAHTVTMMGKQAKDGPFTPIVKAARTVLGDSTLTKVRGDVIAKHSQVIKAFCDTGESPTGKIALKQVSPP